MKKQDKHKKQLRELQAKLNEAKRYSDFYKKELDQERDKVRILEQYKKEREGAVRLIVEGYRYQVGNLMEIIRWSSNPNTANYPFRVLKSEMTEVEKNSNFQNR